MSKISNLFSDLGFKVKIHDDKAFHCQYKHQYNSDEAQELTLYVSFIDSIISIQAEQNGLKRTLVDNTTIYSVKDMLFVLSRSVFIETTLKNLYQKITQYRI